MIGLRPGSPAHSYVGLETFNIQHRVATPGRESLNAKIQWAKYTQHWIPQSKNFINAIYFHCGGLDLAP
ncbi:MAG: hypothetical protein DMG13_33770 [Acidobacteria bacterium]|nr:MAG: hypothetical protein DMG13_33770 [Acidobacteriota bacterium]